MIAIEYLCRQLFRTKYLVKVRSDNSGEDFERKEEKKGTAGEACSVAAIWGGLMGQITRPLGEFSCETCQDENRKRWAKEVGYLQLKGKETTDEEKILPGVSVCVCT